VDLVAALAGPRRLIGARASALAPIRSVPTYSPARMSLNTRTAAPIPIRIATTSARINEGRSPLRRFRTVFLMKFFMSNGVLVPTTQRLGEEINGRPSESPGFVARDARSRTLDRLHTSCLAAGFAALMCGYSSRWQLDPGAWLIAALERSHLAWDVIRISPQRQQAKRGSADAG
jgi:hypothetical protein